VGATFTWLDGARLLVPVVLAHPARLLPCLVWMLGCCRVCVCVCACLPVQALQSANAAVFGGGQLSVLTPLRRLDAMGVSVGLYVPCHARSTHAVSLSLWTGLGGGHVGTQLCFWGW
jgi:hypothetical protein